METHLGRMSIPDAEERLRSGSVVLIPFGALEAHGLHLPLGADYLVAEEIALRASRLADAIVAPTMPYGYAPAFRGFAGNVSTRMEITQWLAEDIMADLAAAGAKRFIFVDNHAGNDPPLEAAARTAQDRLGIAVAHFYPWKVMTAWGPELFGSAWNEAYGHGAEPNTSVLLYLMPEAVQMQHAVKGALAPFGGKPMASSRFVDIDGVQHQLYLRVRQINDSSITGGDPKAKPDPKIGRTLVDRAATSLAQLIEWFRGSAPTSSTSKR